MKTTKAQQAAHGQDCTLRIPLVCNWNTETTVLAHTGSGSAKRNHDEEAVYSCSACHDAIDFRSRVFLSHNEAEQKLLHRMRKSYIEDAKERMP
jgi:hypothetical protein